MSQLVKFWTDLVASGCKTVDDVPEKIKSAIVAQLINSGVLTDTDVEVVREAKIAEMSAACNKRIEEGIDVTLSDGEIRHFSLEVSDQLKISKLNDRAKAGVTELPYHADGESCKFYTAEDVGAINTAMENCVEFNVTYFNSLRDYIRSMTEIADVNAVKYGIDIPVQYQSEVLQAIYAQMLANK